MTVSSDPLAANVGHCGQDPSVTQFLAEKPDNFHLGAQKVGYTEMPVAVQKRRQMLFRLKG